MVAGTAHFWVERSPEQGVWFKYGLIQREGGEEHTYSDTIATYIEGAEGHVGAFVGAPRTGEGSRRGFVIIDRHVEKTGGTSMRSVMQLNDGMGECVYLGYHVGTNWMHLLEAQLNSTMAA